MKARLGRMIEERAGTISLAILLGGAILLGIALAGGMPAGADRVGPSRGGDGGPERTFRGGATLRETIATARSNDYRVKLRARARRRMGPATIRIAASQRVRGEWRQIGRALRVGRARGWFWPSVTDRFGVRRFTIATGREAVPMMVSVRLPTSQEGDVSPPFRFAVDEGRFFQIDV